MWNMRSLSLQMFCFFLCLVCWYHSFISHYQQSCDLTSVWICSMFIYLFYCCSFFRHVFFPLHKTLFLLSLGLNSICLCCLSIFMALHLPFVISINTEIYVWNSYEYVVCGVELCNPHCKYIVFQNFETASVNQIALWSDI